MTNSQIFQLDVMCQTMMLTRP